VRSLPEAQEDVLSPWKLIATTSVFTVSFSVLSIAFAKLVLTALTTSLHAAAFILE